MTDDIDEQLRDLGARWREHVDEDVPPTRRRRDLTWIAAAVVMAVALGATLWLTRGLGDGTQEPAPAPQPELVNGAVPWAALDPTSPNLDTATRAAYDAIEVEGSLDREVGDEERIGFTVTLTSPTGVTLDPCPDYEVSQQNSWDDYSSEPHALNCAGIPFRDADGRPFLPSGEPVRFAMETSAPGTSVPVTWQLVTGGEPDTASGDFIVRQSLTAPRPHDYCANLTFQGREYKMGVPQTGSGIGRPTGTAAGTNCGSRGSGQVEVYSVNEQSTAEALTATYGDAVVVYVAGEVDQIPFPNVVADQGAPPSRDDLGLLGRFARFAISPGSGPLAVGEFAERARIGLGGELRPVDRADVADPSTWTFDLDGFAGAVGPINLLDVVREHLFVASSDRWPAGDPDLIATLGDHRRCAGPPGADPPGVEGLRHLAIQPNPETTDSCLQWFAIDLYLDDTGRIAAVSLDLWEP